MTTTETASTLTSAEQNAAAVGAVYSSFGRGDVAAILELLADDVSWDGDWADNFGQRESVDHFRPRHGRAEVAEFFGALSQWSVHHLEVLSVVADDRLACAQVVIDATLPGGGRFRDEELHVWTFGGDGRIVALRHYIDTAKHLAAARGQDTTRTRPTP